MIIIRVNGNNRIGMGHVMRCLALADRIRSEQHEEVEFVISHDTPGEIIESNGYKANILSSTAEETKDETDELVKLLSGLDPKGVVVDSYDIDEEYFIRIRKDYFVLYIDDLALCPYPVDYILNYNIYADEGVYKKLYDSRGITLPKLLLGPKYSLLRKQFTGIEKIRIKDQVKNIFVSSGGSDPESIILRTVRAVKDDPSQSDKVFHCVVGSMNPDYGKIKNEAASSGNIVIHYNVSDMASLMCDCDVAVSAAGSTLYELCACCVPTITYVLADNQIAGAECFSQKGLMLYLGDCRDNKDFISDMLDKVDELCRDKGLREQLSVNMSKTLQLS